jgi:hypothetical protein
MARDELPQGETRMAEYSTDLEHLSSQLRVYRQGSSYGEQYLWTCTVRWISPQEAELMAVSEFPDLDMRHAIAKAMFEAGAERGFFTRIKNGQKRRVDFNFRNLVRRRARK